MDKTARSNLPAKKNELLAEADTKIRTGLVKLVRYLADGTAAADTPTWEPAFDVTPAAHVTALITERGVCRASADGLATLFPEHTQ